LISPMNEQERKAAIEKAAANAKSAIDEPMSWLDELDYINKPLHYNIAPLECIDAMEAMVAHADVHPHASYCWQNSFKYLWRWPYKNGVEDLKKARWYIDRLITKLEGDDDYL
jgi:hypothetical protein